MPHAVAVAYRRMIREFGSSQAHRTTGRSRARSVADPGTMTGASSDALIWLALTGALGGAAQAGVWTEVHGARTPQGVDRVRLPGGGTKRHLLTDSRVAPLSLVISGGNRHNLKKLEELLDMRVIAQSGDAEANLLCLDRGYDYKQCREQARERRYTPHIPPKSGEGRLLPPPGDPDRHCARRWVVEVAHSWFNRFRRLLMRWESRSATISASPNSRLASSSSASSDTRDHFLDRL